MNLHMSSLEQRTDDWIEGVVRHLYQPAHTPGVSQLLWLERPVAKPEGECQKSLRVASGDAAVARTATRSLQVRSANAG